MKNKKSSKKKGSKPKSKKESEKKKEEIEEVKKEKDADISDIEKEIEKIKSDEVEFNEQLFEEPVRQIPLSAERAPVLERIIERETPSSAIETNSERAEETGNQRRINYSPVSNQPNYGFQRNTTETEEKKYESNFVPPVLSRREFAPREIRQDFLNSQRENRIHDSNEPLSREIELVEQERRLPFEEQQKKYKKFMA